ncbi:MAG: hypothetical protein AB1333_01855 [Patescibacteria group bacterium]
MNSETKQCQNCKQNFIIESEDFDFYKKIEVPPPTFCPECRLQRRMIWRNARVVYKRADSGNFTLFSAFSPDSPLKIYNHDYWWSDAWDPMEYGKEYNFSLGFFKQLNTLMREVPWAAGFNKSSINSPYCNNVYDIKNCYLMFNSGHSEDCMYGTDTLESSHCMDTDKAEKCTKSYELFDCENCYNTFFSSHCKDCVDIWFGFNLVDCHNCFGCVNLKHKKNCIFNKQVSEKEFKEFIGNSKLGSYESVLQFKKKFEDQKMGFPVRFMHGTNNVKVSGDYVSYSKGCRNVFYSKDLENCSWCSLILFMPGKDSHDMTVAGGELCYEIEEGGGYNMKSTWYSGSVGSGGVTMNVEYSMNCHSCSNIFACVGLRNKEYCIFNKQYSKEEYQSLKKKIIEDMNKNPYIDAKGREYRYGEFFPSELSPFAYNETLAYEFFPLTKDEILKQGYMWKEMEEKRYTPTKKHNELPDDINDVSDDILADIIECAHKEKCNHGCTSAFRIVKQELDFYKEAGLPLPHLCHNCRHCERTSQRNPLKLWNRQCQCVGTKSENGIYTNTAKHHHEGKCSNEFETSYSPEREEIVYCADCYQAEVA